MNEAWNQLQSCIARWGDVSPSEREEAVALARTVRLTIDDLPQALDAAEQLLPAGEAPLPGAADETTLALVDVLLAGLASNFDWRPSAKFRGLSTADARRAADLYARLGAASRGRFVLLQLLTADGRASALASFAELMVVDPPAESRQIGMAFFPLFQQTDYAAKALFPRLLDGLARPETATLVLDVANFAQRQGLLKQHPAHARVNELGVLLGGVIQRLLQIEEHPQELAATPDKARQLVADWIALSVTLCQALGLIGDASVSGKLEQALGVGHRGLRTEAAVALARLGEKRGRETLETLAAEPATRSSALACLDELGIADKVPEELRTPGARAAGELAEWLARPAQFGMPPTSVEPVDHCRQYWPGFEEPIDCYLLSFEYVLGQGEYANVGIVGPVTQVLTADLEGLVPADVYAVFAGWQAEHEEIQEQLAAELAPELRSAAEERLRQLGEQGFSQIGLVKIGSFFGETLLVATAQRQGMPGTVIVDGAKVEWYPAGESNRPIGPQEAYWMHKGRKLLATFNSPASAPAEPPESMPESDD